MALVNERARILSNGCVGPNLYLMTLSAPAIAAAIEPGQFVHMKIPGMEGHILRRPFSVYAADAAAGTLDVLYQTVGFGTNHLAGLAPEAADAEPQSELIGPVGRRWNAPEGCKRALLVAGGVGAAPLFMLCQELVAAGVHVDVVLGAQTQAALVTLERYQQTVNGSVAVATDDGSFGRAGFCTSLSQEALDAGVNGERYDYAACCGPEPLRSWPVRPRRRACRAKSQWRSAWLAVWARACRASSTPSTASAAHASTGPCSMPKRWCGR